MLGDKNKSILGDKKKSMLGDKTFLDEHDSVSFCRQNEESSYFSNNKIKKYINLEQN